MDRRPGLAFAVAVIAFAGVTTLVGIASGAPLEFLVLDLVTGMAFVVAGLAAVWLRPRTATGPLLLLSGGLWYIGSYAPSGQPVVTHLGFAFERYYDLALAALLLLLSSPSQRVEPRALVGVLAAAMGARSLGRLLLVDPVRVYGCETCPPNPFALWPDRVAFEIVEIVANLAIAVLLVTVAVVVLRRLARAGLVLRRVRWPILGAGGIAMGASAWQASTYAWATATGGELLSVPEPLAAVLGWSLFVARTLVPLAFLVATLGIRRSVGPLAPFAADLARPAGSGETGDALRSALGDPSLALLRPAGAGTWTGEDGTVVPAPAADERRSVTIVGTKERPSAAIVHDRVLEEQPELLEAVVRVLRLALENERLEAEVREQLVAVTESRQRIVAAAEEERRRVERDLHDGAQQRLVGVMLALQEARSLADAATVPPAIRDRLDAAVGETSEAIRELRELARGIHPAILEDAGLAAAVAAVARRVGIPVEVRVTLDERLPTLVESTAYFTVAEALTNIQRHASASGATIRVTRNEDALDLEVTDDGRGGAAIEAGSGLRGLADRVMALGGSFDVDSPAGSGTRVRARIPLP